MQKSYSHSVPKDNGASGRTVSSRRMCVVFRTGIQKCFEKDTGEACLNLLPKKAMSYTYGHVDGLKEGCFYTRRELLRMNAFQVNLAVPFSQQLGLSFNGLISVHIMNCIVFILQVIAARHKWLRKIGGGRYYHFWQKVRWRYFRQCDLCRGMENRCQCFVPIICSSIGVTSLSFFALSILSKHMRNSTLSSSKAHVEIVSLRRIVLDILGESTNW